MKAILCVLLVATLALAGCTGSSSTSSSSPSTSGTSAAAGSASGSTGQSGSSTSQAATTSGTTTTGATSSSTAANRAPVITAFLSNVTSGTAPLSVSFNFTASDPDGDSLLFSLSFGDGSANATGSLPKADLTHLYAQPGNYTAKLTVNDGKIAVNRTATLTVLGAATGVIQSETVTWPATNGACGGPYDTWVPGTPAEGVAWVEIDIVPASIGAPYTAAITYTSPSPFFFVTMDFYDAEDALVAGGFASFGETAMTGTVPVGAVYAVFADCFTTGGSSVVYVAG